MVGEVVQVWRPRELNTHETEWGFSCMSYEISGALGIKMANPDKEVISFIGDGSYLMNNTDIYSSVITNNKLIVVVCDNGGFQTDVADLADANGNAVTPGNAVIADTTTIASGEMFRFTVTLTNCDEAAIVGASLPLTLNVEGGGDTRVDLEIESIAVGAKLI